MDLWQGQICSDPFSLPAWSGLMLGGSLQWLCAAVVVVVVVMLQLQFMRSLFLLADVGAPAGTNWLCYAPIIGCHQ